MKRMFSLMFLSLLLHCGSQSMAQVPNFDGKRALAYIVKQCDFGPRNPGSEGHRKCRDFFVDTLKSMADQVTTQPFMFSFGSPKQSMTGTNIIARFQPQKSDRILLCAHWDTRHIADEDPDPAKRAQPVMGANDGGSGVAVLLTIAELLRDQKTTVGIDIVLFDAEDVGDHYVNNSWALGSQAFARQYANSFAPRYGILLDMVGDADLQIFQDYYSVAYAERIVDMVWGRAAELGYHAFIPQVGYTVFDDHVPLLQAGIQCVDIIDFNYKYWHTTSDTPDKCSAASLKTVGQVVTNLIFSEN